MRLLLSTTNTLSLSSSRMLSIWRSQSGTRLSGLTTELCHPLTSSDRIPAQIRGFMGCGQLLSQIKGNRWLTTQWPTTFATGAIGAILLILPLRGFCRSMIAGWTNESAPVVPQPILPESQPVRRYKGITVLIAARDGQQCTPLVLFGCRARVGRIFSFSSIRPRR